MKAVKVTLKSGFVGYVLGGEFFIIGSMVKCFDRLPESHTDWVNLVSEHGVVSKIH